MLTQDQEKSARVAHAHPIRNTSVNSFSCAIWGSQYQIDELSSAGEHMCVVCLVVCHLS